MNAHPWDEHIRARLVELGWTPPHGHTAVLAQARDALTLMVRRFTGSPSTLRESEARVQAHEAIRALDAALGSDGAHLAATPPSQADGRDLTP